MKEGKELSLKNWLCKGLWSVVRSFGQKISENSPDSSAVSRFFGRAGSLFRLLSP